jgi:hypothetical protein
MSRKNDKKVIKQKQTKTKLVKIHKYVQHAIAMYMSLNYWHFVEI